MTRGLAPASIKPSGRYAKLKQAAIVVVIQPQSGVSALPWRCGNPGQLGSGVRPGVALAPLCWGLLRAQVHAQTLTRWHKCSRSRELRQRLGRWCAYSPPSGQSSSGARWRLALRRTVASLRRLW